MLLVSAGGAALAAQGATGTARQGATTTTSMDKNRAKARAGVLGCGGVGHGLGRRVLHGEVTVQTRDGRKTLVLARGKVTALSADAITITSADDVVTAFRVDGDTRFGFLRQPRPRAELKVGDQALVVGEKSGDANLARRVVTAADLPAKSGGGATP